MRERMIFGFSLLAILGALAAIIAVGHVVKETSYGLEVVLGCLVSLSAQFAQWFFNQRGDKDK